MSDVSSEVASMISSAKVFGASDNIRHGRYKLLIKRIFADIVEIEAGKHRFAFWEFTVLESSPNPQVEGDHTNLADPTSPLKDDGTKPNMVGTSCALKVDFDGPGARSAGSNIQAAILALFNKKPGEVSEEEIAKTWTDLSRRKAVRKGEPMGFDPATNQVILATEDKQANPACGMVIGCTTMTKKKKVANDKGAYITKLLFSCAAPIGQGDNAPDVVAKRRAEIEATQYEDEEETTPAVPTTPAPYSAPIAPQAAPPAPPAPPVPSTGFTPSAPWRLHPEPKYQGATPDTRWYWDGGTGLKTETQLKAGA